MMNLVVPIEKRGREREQYVSLTLYLLERIETVKDTVKTAQPIKYTQKAGILHYRVPPHWGFYCQPTKIHHHSE